MNNYGRIQINLKVEHVNKLCSICDNMNFDVNVICGRVCVDGRSAMGVMEMCGRVVTLSPVTNDEYEIETFFREVQPLGAYKVYDY